MELAQALDHPRVLLRYDLDRFNNEQDRNGQEDDCNFHDFLSKKLTLT
jgi:hypothetical protein